MAGDWLKMRIDLPQDPAVIAIAAATGIDEDSVVGKLLRVWGWANRNTTDGNAPSVTQTWLDRYTGVTGFAQAMQKQGWLVVSEGDKTGLIFPKFDEHMSDSAKSRALTAKRASRSRNANSNARTVTKSAPREEKRREENNTGARFIEPALEEVNQYCLERKNQVDPNHFIDYYATRGWKIKGVKMKDWKAAVRTWEKNRFNSAESPQASEPDDHQAEIADRAAYEARVKEAQEQPWTRLSQKPKEAT